MKRLYSPWRSTYIESFKSKKTAERCLFCRIAKEKKDERNLVVHRGKHNYVVLNLYPYNSGHLMIVPYRHTRDMGKLSEDAQGEAMGLTIRSLKALEKTSKPHGYNFGANIGRVAGAGIEKHVHFHVVPRWNGDTNFMPVLGETKLISEDLKVTWRKLKKEFKRSL